MKREMETRSIYYAIFIVLVGTYSATSNCKENITALLLVSAAGEIGLKIFYNSVFNADQC